MTQPIHQYPKAYEGNLKTTNLEQIVDGLRAEIEGSDGGEEPWVVDQPGYTAESLYTEDQGGNSPASGNHPQSVDDIRGQLQDLLHFLASSDVSISERKKIEGEIQKLQGKINYSQGYISDSTRQLLLQDVSTQLSALQAQVFGIETPGTSGGDGSLSDDSGDGSLTSSLTEFKQKVADHPNLSSEQKAEYNKKIDKWLSNLELDASDETISRIEEEFDELQMRFTDESNYPSGVAALAQVTDKEASEIEDLLEKHHIDPEHLPTPPDSKIANLLNDPAFSDLSENLQDVQKSKQDLTNAIDNKVGEANALNQSNQAMDDSMAHSTDLSSFRFLYNAKFHRDELSLNLISARQRTAEKAATLLSALYGQEITANKEPQEGGMISFNGQSLNILARTNPPEIQFSQENPDWTEVDLVPYFVDTEGDGMTPVVTWMNEAHYPISSYDTGSDHAWHDISGNSNSVTDINREV